ncbi:acyl-CoA reductase-like NAD-dependent aldehyde dehydrogenase [Metapseudomonas resinovorans]|uniref:hypothetical protein n=1 Tax=Metapseudomonas resinovorans TaxID=53412 RepID=UPI003D1CD33D
MYATTCVLPAVWTQDINRALRVARAVETERMWVNTYHDMPAHKSILEAYRQRKNVFASLNEAPHGLC